MTETFKKQIVEQGDKLEIRKKLTRLGVYIDSLNPVGVSEESKDKINVALLQLIMKDLPLEVTKLSIGDASFSREIHDLHESTNTSWDDNDLSSFMNDLKQSIV
jgi:hypothetical protein